MKKCTFISIIRKNNSYNIIHDIKPFDPFSELVHSLHSYEKIDIINFTDLTSDVNLFITFDIVDVNATFTEFLYQFLKSVNCKNVFIDFSTYDNQEISEEDLDTIESLTDKPIYFLTKNNAII